MSKKFVLSVFSLLFIFTSCTTDVKYKDIPIVKNGVLDIRNWDFNNSGNLSLRGEWEFYWQKLYNPQDFKKQNIEVKHFSEVPNYWNNISIDTMQLWGQSYATYRIKIISDKRLFLSAFINEQMTAYNFWCNDSLIFRCGKVATNKKEAVPQRRPIVKNIEIVQGTNELIFQISNYHHKKGGFYTSPQIGSPENIHLYRDRNISMDIFLFGSLLILGLYHLTIALYRRNAYSVLVFSIFSLILALRTLLTGSRFFCTLFPSVSWTTQMRLEYFTAYFSASFFVAYIYLIFKEDINKKIVYIVIIINTIICFSLFLPAYFYTLILPAFHLSILCTLLYYLYRIFVAAKKGRNGALLILSSLVIFTLTVIADILLARGNHMDRTDLLPLGVFVLMLGQSLVFAKLVNQHFINNENLRIKLNEQNKELESIVKKQSHELKQQQKFILKQNKAVEKQNEEIKDKNNELLKQTTILEKSEEKMDSIFQLLPESVFEIDWEGNVLLANNEFYENTGYTNEDKLNIKDFFLHKESSSLFFNCMSEYMKDSNIVKELKIEIRKKDQSLFPALLSASRLDNNKVVAYRCTFTDITHRILDQETIKNAYEEIKEKNKHIADSLMYASTIQKAVMPSKTMMAKSFKNNFVINKPHSIVSGDFYFLKKKDDKIIFALSDCTGHGVPGGFMTMLGITLLNQIYSDDELVSPEIALDMMRSKVIQSLHQETDNSSMGNKDGMDMILCILDTKTLLLKFASAKQTLLLSRGCYMQKFNGDRMPVGIYATMDNYTLHEIQLQKNDILYYYTDGVIDIFGGEKEKRLRTTGLERIIHSCCKKDMEGQKTFIYNELNEWKGDKGQIDDMLMIGVQV